MKRIHTLLAIAAMAAACFSCDKQKEEQEVPGTTTTFTLDRNAAVFVATGGSETIKVTSNVAWTVSGPQWLTITPDSGDGNAEVTLTAAANEDPAERTGKVIFSYKGKNSEVSVSQEAAEQDVPLPTTDPQSVDKTSIVSGESVTLTFDTTVWSMATDITWTWQEGETTRTLEGAVVTTPVEVDYLSVTDNSPVEIPITVTATVNGEQMSWEVKVTATPYVLFYKDWGMSSAQAFRYTCPVYSADKSTVYAVTDRSGAKLYAFDNATGAKKWEFDPGEDRKCCTTPTVNPVTGDIYYMTTTAKEIFSVKSDGTLKWQYEGMEAVNKCASAVVSKDGSVVFFADNSANVHAVKASTGEKIWGVTLVGNVQGMVLNGNELFCACDAMTGGGVFLNATDGTTIASVDLYKNCNDGSSISVDPVKKIAYIPSKGSNQSAPSDPTDYSLLNLNAALTAVDLAKHEVIAFDDVATNSFWGSVVLSNGDIIIADKDGYIARYESATLNVVWKKGSWKRNSYNYGQPVVDTDGNIYLSAGNNNFAGAGHTIKISPDGEVLSDWANTKFLEGPMGGIGLCNGVLCIPANVRDSQSGPILGKYVGKDIATTGWPCHGGDLQGTGCLK